MGCGSFATVKDGEEYVGNRRGEESRRGEGWGVELDAIVAVTVVMW